VLFRFRVSLGISACEKYHKVRERSSAVEKGGCARLGAPWESFDDSESAGGRMFRTMGLGLRDLRVWQEAVALGAEVIRALRQTNRREIKSITEHTMMTAMGVAEHIAEGYGRYAPGEQRELYRLAKRDLLRLETALAVARQAELLSATHHAQLTTRIQTVGRLLSGFLVYLDRQLTAEAS
jgi:four helix bundle protein